MSDEARRLAVLNTPLHPITVLDGRCAICWRPVYETADFRGGRYRHAPTDECGWTGVYGWLDNLPAAEPCNLPDWHEGPHERRILAVFGSNPDEH